MTPLIAEGYASAKEVTRHHAKSFFFASMVLFGQRRASAFALYAFCRRLDDTVDAPDGGDLQAKLAAARATVATLYRASSIVIAEPELAALSDTIVRSKIPPEPFQELINGMEMDLVKTRYATYEELDLYCYRVAGVVGLMMTPVLGCADDRALPYAADLGRAMQLTNILRDVKEDFARGRIYLPQSELAAFGLDESDLAAFCSGARIDERWVSFMQMQVQRARELYARSALGVPALKGFGSQRVVRLMSAVYGGILGAIEAQGYDVFAARAHLPMWGKLKAAAKVCLTPNPRASNVALLASGASP